MEVIMKISITSDAKALIEKKTNEITIKKEIIGN